MFQHIGPQMMHGTRICYCANYRLHTIILQSDDEGADRICWDPTLGGAFSVRTAYAIATTTNSYPIPVWSCIWKLAVPQRGWLFVWLLYHGKLMKNLERSRRGFTSNSYCPCCPSVVKDLDHLFRTCPKVANVWSKLVYMHVLHPNFT